MNITLAQLTCIMPKAGVMAALYLPHVNAAMAEGGIDTKARQSPFLAQFAHETGQLARVSENLNYTPQAILDTFNRKVQRFTQAQARQYGRTADHAANQEMIANIAYANRMGNGDVASGDGWRHRGAGGFQVTGADNQRLCAVHFAIPFDQIGDWLRTPAGACRSAAWYWSERGCNALADAGNIDAISDVINIGRVTREQGDAIGFAERLALTNLATKVLA